MGRLQIDEGLFIITLFLWYVSCSCKFIYFTCGLLKEIDIGSDNMSSHDKVISK